MSISKSLVVPRILHDGCSIRLNIVTKFPFPANEALAAVCMYPILVRGMVILVVECVSLEWK